MQEKLKMTCNKKKTEVPKYTIRLDAKTVLTVNQDMLFTKSRWLIHFGSFEAIQEFIDNYNNK